MVRTRSDDKRREIVRVAARAFQELGFERTSMLTIAERLRGGERDALQLFRLEGRIASGGARLRRRGGRRPVAQSNSVPQKACARVLAHRSAKSIWRASSRPLASRTFETSRPSRPSPGIGELYQQHPVRGLETTRRRLRGAHGSRCADARRSVACGHALQRAWFCRTCSNGSFSTRRSGPTPKRIETAAKHGTDAFLRIYGQEMNHAEESTGSRSSLDIHASRARTNTSHGRVRLRRFFERRAFSLAHCCARLAPAKNSTTSDDPDTSQRSAQRPTSNRLAAPPRISSKSLPKQDRTVRSILLLT